MTGDRARKSVKLGARARGNSIIPGRDRDRLNSSRVCVPSTNPLTRDDTPGASLVMLATVRTEVYATCRVSCVEVNLG